MRSQDENHSRLPGSDFANTVNPGPGRRSLGVVIGPGLHGFSYLNVGWDLDNCTWTHRESGGGGIWILCWNDCLRAARHRQPSSSPGQIHGSWTDQTLPSGMSPISPADWFPLDPDCDLLDSSRDSGYQAGTQVENEPAAYKGQKEITPIRGPFAAPAGLCPSLL